MDNCKHEDATSEEERSHRDPGMEKLQMGGLSDDLILKAVVFSRVDEYPLVASCSRLNRRFNQVVASLSVRVLPEMLAALKILNCDSLWEDICKRVMHGKQPPQNGFNA
eukprot:768041-Hanusia_phi.AAC.2